MPPHRPRRLPRMGIFRLLLHVTPALGQDNRLPGHLTGGGDTLWVASDCRCGHVGRVRPAFACMHSRKVWAQVSEGRTNLKVACFEPGCDKQLTIAKYSRATHTTATIRCGDHGGSDTL